MNTLIICATIVLVTGTICLTSYKMRKLRIPQMLSDIDSIKKNCICIDHHLMGIENYLISKSKSQEYND